MPTLVALRYRAFLSYSHKDSNWAKWLHSRIEGFRIDKDIVGRTTPMGPIPKAIRPVFRDRHDFDAGATLKEQTIAALDASAALVVLCSPAAAKSGPVNEEVRLFKWRHPNRPVIPLVLDGIPHDAGRECFPPALCFQVADNGALTSQPVEVLAADVRETGDGRQLAVAKVLARLIGLAPDEVFRRAERERRRNGRLRGAITAVLALLSVGAAGSATYAWQQLKTNETFLDATLKHATDIVNTAVAHSEKFNVPRAATVELLLRAEGLFDVMAQLGRPTPELLHRRALMLIDFARNYQLLGRSDRELETATDARGLLASLSAGNPRDTTYREDLAVAHDQFGATLQSSPAEAIRSFQDALVLRQELVRIDPENARWQLALSKSYTKVGGALIGQGKLDAALQMLHDALAIQERLAKTGSNNNDVERQHDQGLSYNKIGDVLVAQGNWPEALKAFHDCLVIYERLAKIDPSNTRWQMAISVLQQRIGSISLEQRNLPEALVAFRKGIAIFERLVKIDPDNVGWQRGLAVSYIYAGRTLRDQSNLSEAVQLFMNSLNIMERLSKVDPKIHGWQSDISSIYDDIGRIFLEQGNLPEALTYFRKSLSIMDRLVKLDPSRANWQRGLSLAYGQLAHAYRIAGQMAEAREALSRGQPIIERLLEKNPTTTTWQRDLTWFSREARQIVEDTIQVAEHAGQYDEASKLQDSIAASIEQAETKREGKPGRDTANALGIVAWRALLARDFSKALAASDRAILLASDFLWIESKRAHALLFLGRNDEAKALYLVHKGEKLGGNDSKLWEQVIAEDFAEFRRTGLTHPMIAELEALLGIAVK